MGMPYSWSDETSDYIWVVVEDVQGDPTEAQNLEILIIDKEMEDGGFEADSLGFSQHEFLRYARQLVAGVAQMQLLGRPHGNVCPRAFGLKQNGMLKLADLFDPPCYAHS